MPSNISNLKYQRVEKFEFTMIIWNDRFSIFHPLYTPNGRANNCTIENNILSRVGNLKKNALVLSNRRDNSN